MVLPVLRHIDREENLAIRLEMVTALSILCTKGRSAKKCNEALDILEQVALETKVKAAAVAATRVGGTCDDDDDVVVAAAISGLIRIINARICHQPASITVRAIDITIKYLETNYEEKTREVFTGLGKIREQVFTLLMSMRTDENYHLGIEVPSKEEDEEEGRMGKVVYSPFLVMHQQRPAGPAGDATPAKADAKTGVTYMSLTRGCMMVIACLSQERDWQVLKLVLSRVPNVLQNKAMLAR